MFKWLLYTATLAFAIYWASNLLLWFPWSYNALLGTTFYGYGFVIVLPYILAVTFKKKITLADFIKTGAVGLICLLALVIIIRWKIEI